MTSEVHFLEDSKFQAFIQLWIVKLAVVTLMGPQDRIVSIVAG